MKKIASKAIKKFLAVYGYRIEPITHNPYASDPDYPQYERLLAVPGFLSFPAFKLFAHLEKLGAEEDSTERANVLEIGVYCGMSLLGLGMIYKKRKITGVDPFFEAFEGTSFDAESEFLKHKAKNMTGTERMSNLLEKAEEFGMQERIDLRRITQEEFFKEDPIEKYQLAYIDGEHTNRSIVAFSEKMDELLARNGFIVFDDFLSPGFPGISEAIHTHPSYKRSLFPICYAFNKAVFVYKPRKNYLDERIDRTKQFAKENHFRWHQCDHDTSLVLQG